MKFNEAVARVNVKPYLEGRSDAAFRRAPKFRRCDDGAYERLESLMRGWVAVDDPTEAIAYLDGFEEGGKP